MSGESSFGWINFIFIPLLVYFTCIDFMFSKLTGALKSANSSFAILMKYGNVIELSVP